MSALFPNQKQSSPLPRADEFAAKLREICPKLKEWAEDEKDIVRCPWLSRGQAWRIYYRAKELGLPVYVVGHRDNEAEEHFIGVRVRQYADGSYISLEAHRHRSSTFLGPNRAERWGIHASVRHDYSTL
jgi:hypothetical protein